MKKSRLLIAAISIFIVIASALSSCATISKQIAKSSSEKIELNAFTGMPGANGPVLAVKIDDTNLAHPQIGLELPT